MKKYIIASSNGYHDMFRKIVDYFESYLQKKGCTHYSYNDYIVEPDFAGGGIRITLQWDDDISETEVGDTIASWFGSGVSYSRSWGNWNHQITIHVKEYHCR